MALEAGKIDFCALGVEPKRDRTAAKQQLRNRLMEQLENMHPPIILIDEAQLLTPAMLEELRLLTNAYYDSVSPVALLLVGQTELRTRLTMSHRQHSGWLNTSDKLVTKC